VRIDREFLEFYEREFGPVHRTVYLLCRNADVAEEAAQEAFVRALERWGRLGNQPWVGGWVTTTAMNLARRALRRRPPAPGPDPGDGPDAEAALDAVHLWRSVSRLPLRQQQALVLHYRLGLPTTDVAAAMRCGESAVRGYLTRARAALRATFFEEDLDGARPNRHTP
jgi:RNA polymerase sigma factor (sigma-70 family)